LPAEAAGRAPVNGSRNQGAAGMVGQFLPRQRNHLKVTPSHWMPLAELPAGANEAGLALDVQFYRSDATDLQLFRRDKADDPAAVPVIIVRLSHNIEEVAASVGLGLVPVRRNDPSLRLQNVVGVGIVSTAGQKYVIRVTGYDSGDLAVGFAHLAARQYLN